ncbi:MAG: dimethylarginine dimethylaminohydrolase family protein [Candidatus Eiseniibacteriota bacterium]
MLIAVTRPVSPALIQCELTHLERVPIDVARAIAQHADYERLLISLGASVVRAAAAPESPDAVFIEDTAIVLDEVAVIARPGAASRRAETEAVATLLSTCRPLESMTAPATLDGGDVIRLGRTLYVGRSSRTNPAGIEQLRRLTAPFGYSVAPVEFAGCLHLKSAATALSDDLLLFNPAWVSTDSFSGVETVAVDDREPYAGNALRVADALVYPTEFPRTLEKLQSRGLRVATLEYDELAKAEGAVTCCSLVFEEKP